MALGEPRISQVPTERTPLVDVNLVPLTSTDDAESACSDSITSLGGPQERSWFEKSLRLEGDEREKATTEDGEQSLPHSYEKHRKYRPVEISNILCLAFTWHWVAILAAVISALVNVYVGMSDKELFHPLVFKSMFVVLGFMLGFRNVAANRRAEEANNSMQELFTQVWTVIFLFPDTDQRIRIRKAFIFALREMAKFASAMAKREHLWHAALDVKPASCKGGGPFGGSSARALLQNALAQAESEIYDIEEANKMTRRRLLWPHVAKVLGAYDSIMQLCMPAVTDRYAALIDSLLFVFMLLLPWGLTIKPLDFGSVHGVPLHLSSGPLNVFTVLLIALIMLGLNALAQENEDPFGEYAEHIPMRRAVQLFEISMDAYEDRRKQAQKLLSKLKRSCKPWQIEVFISGAMSSMEDLSDVAEGRKLCTELGIS